MEDVAGDVNPVRRIAQEIEERSSLSEDDLTDSLMGILDVLEKRAAEEIGSDPDSSAAVRAAMQFLAYAEMLTIVGGGLLADDRGGMPPEGELRN